MSKHEMAKAQPADLSVHGAPDMGQLFKMCLENKVDPSVLERMVALQERLLDRQAAQDFALALQAFQSECPPVPHDKTATITGNRPYSYDYTSLPFLADFIRPHMKRNGLSYRFDSEVIEGRMTVKCIVRHSGGHSETTCFTVPTSSNAGMSDQQKFASASSFAQRYALRLALGITTGEGEDDDGAGGGAATITAEQAKDLEAKCEEVGVDKARFLKWAGTESFEKVPQARFSQAIEFLKAKEKHEAKKGDGGVVRGKELFR